MAPVSGATDGEGGEPQLFPRPALRPRDSGDTGTIPPPPPDFTPVDGDLAVPPPVPAGYGLIDSPEDAAPVFYGPPLARVLVEAGRVSAEEMAIALHAHQTDR